MPPAAAAYLRHFATKGPEELRSAFVFIITACGSDVASPLNIYLGAAAILLLRGHTVEQIRGPKEGPVKLLNGRPAVWPEREQAGTAAAAASAAQN